MRYLRKCTIYLCICDVSLFICIPWYFICVFWTYKCALLMNALFKFVYAILYSVCALYHWVYALYYVTNALNCPELEFWLIFSVWLDFMDLMSYQRNLWRSTNTFQFCIWSDLMFLFGFYFYMLICFIVKVFCSLHV